MAYKNHDMVLRDRPDKLHDILEDAGLFTLLDGFNL